MDWFLANYSCGNTYQIPLSSLIKILDSISVELSLERSVDWIKLNHNSVGYYIVNYTIETWNEFENLLSHNHQVPTLQNVLS